MSSTTRNEGFTLVELLVVIGIIGLLAAAAVPQVMEAICEARVSKTKSDIRTVRTAIQQAITNENTSFSELAQYGINDDKPELKPYLPERLWAAEGEMAIREFDSAADRIVITLHESCSWTDDTGQTCSGGGGCRISLNLDSGEFECYNC